MLFLLLVLMSIGLWSDEASAQEETTPDEGLLAGEEATVAPVRSNQPPILGDDVPMAADQETGADALGIGTGGLCPCSSLDAMKQKIQFQTQNISNLSNALKAVIVIMSKLEKQVGICHQRLVNPKIDYEIHDYDHTGELDRIMFSLLGLPNFLANNKVTTATPPDTPYPGKSYRRPDIPDDENYYEENKNRRQRLKHRNEQRKCD